jgi:hypothetical protein
MSEYLILYQQRCGNYLRCRAVCVVSDIVSRVQKTTICHLVRLEWCVVAVGFGNGSPGAEYGSFLCAVLSGINTKTMQLGGGQVMRGHGREMALLPNAAKICVF